MPEDYVELVKQLIGHVSETQTIEFKGFQCPIRDDWP